MRVYKTLTLCLEVWWEDKGREGFRIKELPSKRNERH